MNTRGRSDYWGADLPVRQGFSIRRVRVEFYRERIEPRGRTEGALTNSPGIHLQDWARRQLSPALTRPQLIKTRCSRRGTGRLPGLYFQYTTAAKRRCDPAAAIWLLRFEWINANRFFRLTRSPFFPGLRNAASDRRRRPRWRFWTLRPHCRRSLAEPSPYRAPTLGRAGSSWGAARLSGGGWERQGPDGAQRASPLQRSSFRRSNLGNGFNV